MLTKILLKLTTYPIMSIKLIIGLSLNSGQTMETITYTLISSTAVLGVYCNDCGKGCNFGYSWPHDEVAYWTKGKGKILCPDCAHECPDQIYRRVLSEGDIPIYRSNVRCKGHEDWYMFGNDAKNKTQYPYKFCTLEEEKAELESGIPRQEQCNCGNSDCPDIITDKMVNEINTEFNGKAIPYESHPDTERVSLNWDEMISTIFKYNYKFEFEDDIYQVNVGSESEEFIVTKIETRVRGEDRLWSDSSMRGLKYRLYYVRQDLKFTIECKSYQRKKSSSLIITFHVCPVYPLDKGDSELIIRFMMIRLSDHQRELDIRINNAPQIINGEINCDGEFEKVEKITAYSCPAAELSPNQVKPRRCKHSLNIKCGFNHISVYRLTIDQIKSKGYLPYIEQHRPRSGVGYRRQLECCELTKAIGRRI